MIVLLEGFIESLIVDESDSFLCAFVFIVPAVFNPTRFVDTRDWSRVIPDVALLCWVSKLWIIKACVVQLLPVVPACLLKRRARCLVKTDMEITRFHGLF